MNQVIADHGAGLDSQGVDAADVARHLLAQVKDVVVLDAIVPRDGVFAEPPPAYRDTDLIEVADFVMRDHVAKAVRNNNARRGHEDTTTTPDHVIGNPVRAREPNRRGGI